MKKFFLTLATASAVLACAPSETLDAPAPHLPDGSPTPTLDATGTGWMPLNDLGTGTYLGQVGGLYPGGINTPPDSYKDKLTAICSAVKPLNAAGIPDLATGKIGFVSIGASTCKMFMDKFMDVADTYLYLNPKLRLANCAKGGMDIIDISDPTTPAHASYWNAVTENLTAAGLSYNQVQVVYFETDNLHDTTSDFSARTDLVFGNLVTAMHLLKAKFPKLRLCYFNGRTSTQYITDPDLLARHGEPRAYYFGWAVKNLLAAQISGAVYLNPFGADANSPFLAWGFYDWTNGATPRSTDGFKWLPEDTTDGLHPSSTGKTKIANKMLAYFSGNPAAMQWFRE
jgi:hypothetical protein